MLDDTQENNNEAQQQQQSNKKVKLNGNDHHHGGGGGDNPPSKVVHIRNIPSDVTETEVVHLGIPFGRVNNVLVLKVRVTIFVETLW